MNIYNILIIVRPKNICSRFPTDLQWNEIFSGSLPAQIGVREPLDCDYGWDSSPSDDEHVAECTKGSEGEAYWDVCGTCERMFHHISHLSEFLLIEYPC